MPERFHVPVSTTARLELARRLDGRVIAVGTTVVRALESCVAEDGRVHPTRGWTDLVLDQETKVKSRRRHPHRLPRSRRLASRSA